MITKDMLILTKKSADTTPEECKEKDIFNRLEKELKELKESGLGLAAVQIGIHIKAVIIRYRNTNLNMINPRIVEFDSPFVFNREGCLSLSGIRLNTVRYKHVTVEWLDEEGHEHKGVCENEEAVVIQHEIDHLKGILITSRIAPSLMHKRVGRKIGRNEKCNKCGVKFKKHERQDHEFFIGDN